MLPAWCQQASGVGVGVALGVGVSGRNGVGFRVGGWEVSVGILAGRGVGSAGAVGSCSSGVLSEILAEVRLAVHATRPMPDIKMKVKNHLLFKTSPQIWKTFPKSP